MHQPFMATLARFVVEDIRAPIAEKDIKFRNFCVDFPHKLQSTLVIIQIEMEILESCIRIGGLDFWISPESCNCRVALSPGTNRDDYTGCFQGQRLACKLETEA